MAALLRGQLPSNSWTRSGLTRVATGGSTRAALLHHRNSSRRIFRMMGRMMGRQKKSSLSQVSMAETVRFELTDGFPRRQFSRLQP